MPTKLTKLTVLNIASVAIPANRRTFLVIKSAAKAEWTAAFINALPDRSFAHISSGGKKDDDGKTVPRSLRHLPYREADGTVDLPHLRNALSRVNQIDAPPAERAKAQAALQAAFKELSKMDHDAMTFDDAMMGRRLNKVYESIGERYGALIETMNSIRYGDGEDKAAAIKAALMDFLASMKGAVPEILGMLEADVAKQGRKISAERMSRLKAMRDMLNGLIAEAEGDGPMDKQMDASVLAKLGHGIAALFGRAAGADEATVAELEKAAAGEKPPVVSEEVKARFAKAETEGAELKKANDELKLRVEKAEAETAKAAEEARKLRDEAELRKFAEEVAGYKDLGLDPAKDAALLKAVSETLPKEHADRIREIFKAALAQAQASSLFREVGSSGAGPAPESAAGEVEQKMAALVAKNATLTPEAARSAIFGAHPELYERWRRETSVRI